MTLKWPWPWNDLDLGMTLTFKLLYYETWSMSLIYQWYQVSLSKIHLILLMMWHWPSFIFTTSFLLIKSLLFVIHLLLLIEQMSCDRPSVPKIYLICMSYSSPDCHWRSFSCTVCSNSHHRMKQINLYKSLSNVVQNIKQLVFKCTRSGDYIYLGIDVSLDVWEYFW